MNREIDLRKRVEDIRINRPIGWIFLTYPNFFWGFVVLVHCTTFCTSAVATSKTLFILGLVWGSSPRAVSFRKGLRVPQPMILL
jgi:hypothetical protein